MGSPAAISSKDGHPKDGGSSDRRMLSSIADLVPFDNPSVITEINGVPTVSPPIQDVPPFTTAESTGNPSNSDCPPIERPVDHYDRMKAMFAKYNVPFDDSAWPLKPPRQTARVEKQIRMRIRIVCHRCQTNYSSSKECPNCQHRRCQKCTRLPTKKKGKERESDPEQRAEERTEEPTGLSSPRALLFQELTADADPLSAGEAEDEADRLDSILDLVPGRPKRRQDISPTSSIQMGGQHLFRKEPLGGILQSCCKCQGSFVRDSGECPQCTHTRCSECPPLPPKPDEWQTGYYEDAIQPEPERVPRQIKRPRVRVRWTCHECRQLFMQGERRCSNCSHFRCSNCERNPPKRTRQRSSQDAFSALEESFAAVGSSSKQPKVAGDSTAAEESANVEEAAVVEKIANVEEAATVEKSANVKEAATVDEAAIFEKSANLEEVTNVEKSPNVEESVNTNDSTNIEEPTKVEESAVAKETVVAEKLATTEDAGIAEDSRIAPSTSKEDCDGNKAATPP